VEQKLSQKKAKQGVCKSPYFLTQPPTSSPKRYIEYQKERNIVSSPQKHLFLLLVTPKQQQVSADIM